MQEKGEFYKAKFDITESAIAEFGIMCWCREFYIAEFNITESTLAESSKHKLLRQNLIQQTLL